MLLDWLKNIFITEKQNSHEDDNSSWKSGVIGGGPTHVNLGSGEYSYGEKAGDVERFDLDS